MLLVFISILFTYMCEVLFMSMQHLSFVVRAVENDCQPAAIVSNIQYMNNKDKICVDIV